MSFGASFYPNCLSEWNKLDSEMRQLPTLGMFKKRLFSLIRPLPQPVYSIHDPKGLAILTQLRVGLSKLNLHKVKHNVKDTCLVEIRRVSGGNPPEFFQIPRKVPEVFRCFSVKCPDGYR